jgi:glycosyltransferase involved in cell wall biosynthesis
MPDGSTSGRGWTSFSKVLVGSEEEGKIELQAGRIANVRIVPWQRFDVTIPYLYAADVLLIPPCIAPLQQHANTVLPLKVFLYLAAGRAILAPRAPDTSELLVDGENALLVPPGDPDTAVGALRHLMEHPTYRERLGRAALETARHLTWDTRAEKIHRHLEDRLKETQVAGRPLSDSWSVTSWFGETARWLARRIRKG